MTVKTGKEKKIKRAQEMKRARDEKGRRLKEK